MASAAAAHGHSGEALLPVLRSLNAKHGGITDRFVNDVARLLGRSAAQVEGAATFYSLLDRPPREGKAVRICDSLTCWLHGAAPCREALQRHLTETGETGWRIERSSCLGVCDRAPAALVEDRPCGPLSASNVSQALKEPFGAAPDYSEPLPGEIRFVLSRIGRIDPSSIEDAVAHGAWRGLQQALERSPKQVIDEIDSAGLRGRGGAGFPTGRKWRIVAGTTADERFVVCNADESEPLTFKDRVLMETDPHAVLEGMAVCGYAVGAKQGIIYIRGEYEPQACLLEHAVEQAREHGWLGERIAGSDFGFDIQVHRGAGAYICGEESALLESLEGRRGEPRIRPPYPAVAGYRGRPTVVNNVETLAAAAAIIARGAGACLSLGPPDCPGTRLYTLQGHVRRAGLMELPFGQTLRGLIDDFGGGMRDGSQFRFALVGGAAGTFATDEHLDIPLAPAAGRTGIPLGAGGILVCDQTVSPVEALREVMRFFEMESCGKCTPCRIGTSETRRTLDRLLAGDGTAADLARLRSLARSLQQTSLCGLGTSAALPINSALECFSHHRACRGNGPVEPAT